ncbi:MAG: CARDB domain-containing protein [Bacteroidota bacterium]
MKTRLLLTIMLVVINIMLLHGANFQFLPYRITQPNGTVINCFVSGDEFFNWIHDKAGYTIIQGPDGYYYYGQSAGSRIIATRYRVGSINPELSGLTRWAKISAEEYQRIREDNLKYTGSTKTPNTGTMNNLVIYIRFHDDTEFTQNRQVFDDLLNPATGTTMNSYYREVSYNLFSISSTHYPACAMTTNLSYKDSHNRAYFQPYNATTNPDGYNGDAERKLREHTLIKDAVTWINANSPVPSTLNIDADNDGNADDVSFFIKGPNDGWSTLLWAHHWVLDSFSDVKINNKRVWSYIFVPETQIAVTVLCHETFHLIGAPDLYHYVGNNINPVFAWDIMDSGSGHMMSYMKWAYSNHHWISSLPEITTTGTYTINPLTSSSNNCYKIASQMSPGQYYVVEYRKSSGTFEGSLPGSGLLVYRVDPSVTGGNAQGPPDELYLYRPDGTLTVNGNPGLAFYSSTSGRTSLNNETNPNPFLQDGTPGGLDISAVTSAGSTISFKVTFRPDLIIQNPNTSTSAIPAGQTTTATCVVKNQGASAAGTSTLKYYLSDNDSYSSNDLLLTSNPTPAIMNGAMTSTIKTITIPSNTSPGTWYLLFYADGDKQVAETDENNNVGYKQITVLEGLLPDLIVQNPATTPLIIPAGQLTTTSCLVKNQGTAAAGASNLKYYLSGDPVLSSDDQFLASGTVASLATGGTATVSKSITIPATASPGTWYILSYADGDNQIPESNEGNNLGNVQITIIPALQPDLVVLSPAASPLTIPASQTTTASCTVKNQGTAACGASTLKIYLSADNQYNTTDLLLGSVSIVSLAAGGTSGNSKLVTIPAATAAGTWYILFYADGGYQVPEISESNNTGYVQVTIIPFLPDLVIQNPAATPATITVGETATATCLVKNQGVAGAAASTLKYYLSSDKYWSSGDAVLSTNTTPSLASGSSASSTKSLIIPLNTVPGTWYILFYADGGYSVPELYENNNVGYFEITVIPLMPDLVVQIPAANPTTIIAGHNTTVSCSIKNQGTATAGASTMKYYLSADNVYSSNDIQLSATSAIAAISKGVSVSASKLVNIPGSTAPGSWYIIFYADANQVVSERYEDNNFGYKQVTVVPGAYCSGTTTFSANSGTFDDGSGTNNYQNVASCKWLIQPSDGGKVVLHFNEFSTEKDFDFVTVYNGSTTASPHWGPYSGSSVPPSLTSTGSTMLLWFTSDSTVTYPGWSVTYNTIGYGCTSTTQWPSTILTPTPAWNLWPYIFAGTYSVHYVVSGHTYTWSLCSSNGANAPYDSQLTLRKNSDGSWLGYSDDECGTGFDATITWTATFTGQVRVLINEFDCQTNSTQTTLAYRQVSDKDGPFAITDPPPPLTSGLDVRIYPNPTPGHVTVIFNTFLNESADILLMNSSGTVVGNFPGSYVTNAIDLDLGPYPAGLYVISIKTRDQLVVRKVSVIH